MSWPSENTVPRIFRNMFLSLLHMRNTLAKTANETEPHIKAATGKVCARSLHELNIEEGSAITGIRNAGIRNSIPPVKTRYINDFPPCKNCSNLSSILKLYKPTIVINLYCYGKNGRKESPMARPSFLMSEPKSPPGRELLSPEKPQIHRP